MTDSEKLIHAISTLKMVADDYAHMAVVFERHNMQNSMIEARDSAEMLQKIITVLSGDRA